MAEHQQPYKLQMSVAASHMPHTWWRHQMETFSALLAICAENSPPPGEFPAQRPLTRSFDVYFDLRLNKRLSKQSWGWWFETLPRLFWHHSNESQSFNNIRWESLIELHETNQSLSYLLYSTQSIKLLIAAMVLTKVLTQRIIVSILEMFDDIWTTVRCSQFFLIYLFHNSLRHNWLNPSQQS